MFTFRVKPLLYPNIINFNGRVDNLFLIHTSGKKTQQSLSQFREMLDKVDYF